MAILYNTKKGRNETVLDGNVEGLLRKEDSIHLPVPSAKYTVYDEYTNDRVEINGNRLFEALSSGLKVLDQTQEKLERFVKKDSSAIKQFMQNFADEGLTLGLGEDIIYNLADPFEKRIIETERNTFGVSRFAGGVAGLLGGTLLSGGGSLLARGATKLGAGKGLANAISEGVKATSKFVPATALIKGSHKLGQFGAKKAGSKIQKQGLKKITESGVYGGLSLGVDALAYGGVAATGSIASDVIAGNDININEARKKGQARAAEIAKYGGYIMGGSTALRIGFESTKGIAKATGKAVSNTKIYQSIKNSNLIKESDDVITNNFAKYLRTSVFNLKGTHSAEKDFILSAVKNKEYLKRTLTDNDILKFYNTLSKDKKIKHFGDRTPSSPEVRAKFDNLLEDAGVGDVAGLYASVAKGLNGGKQIKSRNDIANLLEEHQKQSGKMLSDLRKEGYDAQKIEVGVVNDLKKFIKSSDEIVEVIAMGDKSFGRELKKFKIKSDTDYISGLVKKYKKAETLTKAEAEKGMVWLLRELAIKGKITDDIKIFMKDNLAKISDDVIDPLMKVHKLTREQAVKFVSDAQKLIRNNQSKSSAILDMHKIDHLLDKKRLTIKDSEYLTELFKRNKVDFSKSRKMKSLRAKIADLADEFLDASLFVNTKSALTVLNNVKRASNKFSAQTIDKSFLNKINVLYNTLKTKKRLNVYDLQNLKGVFDELSKFTKKKGTLSFQHKQSRWISRQLSDLENKMFANMSKSKKYELQKVGLGLKTNKEKYALVSDLTPYFDDITEQQASRFTSRDIMFAMIGAYGGILPAIGMLGISRMLAKRAHFLAGADLVQNYSNVVGKSLDKFRSFSDENYMLRAIRNQNNITTKGLKISRLSQILNLGYTKDLKELDEALSEAIQSSEYFETLGDESSEIAKVIGGEEAELQHKNDMVQLLKMIELLKPQPEVNPITLEKSYKKRDEKRFKYDLRYLEQPDLFFQDIRTGTLTPKDVEIMRSFYPAHFNDFIVNFFGLITQKRLKLNRKLLKSYYVLNGQDPYTFITSLDAKKQLQEKEELVKRRQGGVKFSSIGQETASDRVANL